MKTFVIAEAGSCHDGSFEKALGLIEVAKAGGADAVKFQYWSSAKRLAERRHADAYVSIYDKYALPVTWLPRLSAECALRSIEFMCTAYLPEDIEVVAPYVKRFKVASFEAHDEEFVDAHRGYDKEIIVSVGMEAPIPFGCTVLHCVSAYPTPLDQANLGVVRNFKGVINGFSDHTAFVRAGAYAVCAGARMLEVHIRDWITALDNPDFATALSPSEFAEYVHLVREAELMMGSGDRQVMPAEKPMTAYTVRA